MLRQNFIRVAFLAGFGLIVSNAAIGQTTALTSPLDETTTRGKCKTGNPHRVAEFERDGRTNRLGKCKCEMDWL